MNVIYLNIDANIRQTDLTAPCKESPKFNPLHDVLLHTFVKQRCISIYIYIFH